jgi:hopene-associated glycosyltransferase HpnB
VILELAAGCAAVVWLYLILGRGLFWRLSESRESEAARPERLSKRVAIVIPARDEAQSIGQAIASLLCQDYPGPCHIFLVDDDSQDGTLDKALLAAREGGKPELLTATRARSLPEDWTGKLWSLAEGVNRAEAFRPDYVLFSDADILHAPDNLSRLVERAEAGGYDLVSYMVKLKCETFAEKALIPAFVFFFFMLYPPAWTGSPRHATAGAAGGCILMRWPALARIGGIAAIRGELIDDCALAKAVKSAGGKIWLGLTSKTRSLRGYATFGEIGGMISRTAFWQLRHSPWLLLGTMAGMFITYMLPPLLLLTGRLVPAGLGMAAWALMMVAYAPSLRFYGVSILWAPALPVVALFYAGATVHSALRYWSGRGGEWKGRVQDRKRPS